MAVDAVTIEHLYFRYNSAEVLSDITFTLRAGEYLGLVGPNGSGKTTLVRIILGLENPSQGRVTLFGSTPSDFREWYRVGYVPQKIASFNPHFPATVKEIVAIGLLPRKGFPRRIGRSDDAAIQRALAFTDIAAIGNKLIGELSGGQQQRTLIAKALVSEPDLLILDEPTTALDPEGRENFFAVLKRLNAEKHVAILMITHDIGSIGKYASKLLYVDKRIVFHGGFDDFCMSDDMGEYFGQFSQHIICHRHDAGVNGEQKSGDG